MISSFKFSRIEGMDKWLRLYAAAITALCSGDRNIPECDLKSKIEQAAYVADQGFCKAFERCNEQMVNSMVRS